MTYKIKYDQEADGLTITLKGEGKLSHSLGMGDFVVYVDQNDESLFLEILKASKIVPLMIEGLAKKEIVVA